MAWPTIFKLLGFGLFLGADALKTENAKYQAKNIPTRPEQEISKLGFPEYMRPRDCYGNKKTDEELIEAGRNAYGSLAKKYDEKVKGITEQYEICLKNGNLEVAELWKKELDKLKKTRDSIYETYNGMK